MNRKERRKLEREGKLPKKETTYTIKADQLHSMTAHAQEEAKKRATDAAIQEIDRQILERDRNFSLDLDASVLWTLHRCFGFGKKRLEEFYRAFGEEHTRMREFYEMEDTYPERYKLKEETGVDVEELNRKLVETWDKKTAGN